MGRSKILLISGFVALAGIACGQISPPGIDGAKVVGWGAIGFNQQLSSKWSITAYAGGSRQSDPDNTHLMQKTAIMVLNQESLYSFNSHWQLAFCNSIRMQDIYAEEKPFELEQPGIRNELRYYLRLFYRHSYKRLNFSYNFRPEYRNFYTSDWDKWKTPLELRFRLKGQVNIPLNQSKSNQLIVANELLTVTDHYQAGGWSKYHFTEDRFTNYFRHTFTKPSLVVDLGVMHQFWKEKTGSKLHYTAYLSVDLLFQNPFGMRNKS